MNISLFIKELEDMRGFVEQWFKEQNVSEDAIINASVEFEMAYHTSEVKYIL